MCPSNSLHHNGSNNSANYPHGAPSSAEHRSWFHVERSGKKKKGGGGRTGSINLASVKDMITESP